MQSSTDRARGRRALIALALALIVPALPFAVVGEIPGEAWLDAAGDGAAGFALAGFSILAADIVLPVPSSVVATLLGGRLGAGPAWLVACAGLVVGNVVGYAGGRFALASLGRDLPRAPALGLLAVSRAVPLLAEAVCIAAGASRVPFRAFLAVSVLANGALVAVFVSIGAALLPAGAETAALGIAVAVPGFAWLAWRRMFRAGART